MQEAEEIRPGHVGPSRRRVKRKGHRKSRVGCLNCKERKIKCQETRPACLNCTRSELCCEYPKPAFQPIQPNPSTAVALVGQPGTTPRSFTVGDLRCFHHFMVQAHPHLCFHHFIVQAHPRLPLDTSTAWIQEIPLLAHQYEFLMHAILALGGAHLSFISSPNLTPNTEKHRLLAIKGLNEVIPNQQRSGVEGDAMLAACFALAFVASYRGERLLDFWTMARGCVMVAREIMSSGGRSVMIPEDYFKHGQASDAIDHARRAFPSVEICDIEAAKASLVAVRPFCHRRVELDLHRHMSETVALLELSSRDASFNPHQVYGPLVDISHEEFQRLAEPTNEIGQVLQGHFVAIEGLIPPRLTYSMIDSAISIRGQDPLTCVAHAYKLCSPLGQGLLQWPLQFCSRSTLHIEEVSLVAS